MENVVSMTKEDHAKIHGFNTCKECKKKDDQIQQYHNSMHKMKEEYEAEIEKFKNAIKSLFPQSGHDHDFWHDDCWMCRGEKSGYIDFINKFCLEDYFDTKNC